MSPSATLRRMRLVRTRIALVALWVVVLAVLAPALLLPVEADPADRAAPALDTDVADPEAVFHDGRLLVFSTNASPEGRRRNVPVWTWNGGSDWDVIGDALPRLPAWTSPGRVWAPGVAARPDGRWSLYFTARHDASDRQCIGHAVADGPAGPYVPVGNGPVVCDLAEGGSIDASVFVDRSGRWLTWKTDANALGRPTTLKSVRLDDTGVPVGAVHVLLRSERAWEHGVIENPELVSTASGLVLVYSAGRFADATYAIGTARCDSPAGPCRRTGDVPDLATRGSLVGPGGASLARRADGSLHLFFHTWQHGIGDGAHRALRTEPVDLDTGRVRFRPDLEPVGRPDTRPTLRLRRQAATPSDPDLVSRFGAENGHFVVCDLDGRGVDVVVWFRAGSWYRPDRAPDDPTAVSRHGGVGDRPLCGDFDGDGRDERAVVRGGTVLVAADGDGPARRITLPAGDVALVGDWNGDGTDDVGAWSPGVFTLRTGGNDREVRFSPISAGAPVAGDWDGDGTDEVGLFRDGRFHLRVVAVNVTWTAGVPGDRPLVGRWDGRFAASGLGVVGA